MTYKFEIPVRADLSEMCRVSNNLYNQALYHARQTHDRTGKWMSYGDMDMLMKTIPNLKGEINYRLLPAQTSQQVLRVLDKTIKGYNKALEDWRQHPKKYRGEPECPNYRKRGSMFNLYFTNQTTKIREGGLKLTKSINIPIPQYEKYAGSLNTLQMVRIIPQRKTFRVEIVYRADVKPARVDPTKYASIDPGVNNLCTLFCRDGTLIWDGKFLKSYNHRYNRRVARLRSIKNKQGIKGETKQLAALHDRRKRYFDDAFHKISRQIVDYLIEHGIGNLVVGKNKGWKQKVKMKKKSKKFFVQIPHARLYAILRYKCEMAGIRFIEQQESHTSKCDALAYEEVKHHDEYMGSRIKRGLFRSSKGRVINADVNGAINIMRNVVGDAPVKEIVGSGVSLTPIRFINPFKRVV